VCASAKAHEFEEAVAIPSGFEAGFDVARDRCHHTVTDAGVVVVSDIPKQKRLAAASFERVVAFSMDRNSTSAGTRANKQDFERV
jgi:hypothetical protein